MRRRLSHPPYLFCIVQVGLGSMLLPLIWGSDAEWWEWLLTGVFLFLGFAVSIREFRWLDWDGECFEAHALFGPVRRFCPEELADIRESRTVSSKVFMQCVQFLPKGGSRYLDVTGGFLPGVELAAFLALPGVGENFRTRLMAGERFQIGNRTLRLAGNSLWIKDGDFHPELGTPIAELRITKNFLAEKYLHYSGGHSLRLANRGGQSIWELLVEELVSRSGTAV